MRSKFRVAIFCFAAFISLTACDIQESRPSYAPQPNTLPEGGVLLQWNKQQGLLNVNDVEASLSDENRQVFSKSLDWYATESDYGLDLLSGKSAKQVVSTVNCLKNSTSENQHLCINQPSQSNTD